MRVVPLLVVLLCSLAFSGGPDIPPAAGPADTIVASAADEADYQALQSEADRARDMLAQARGRPDADAQFAIN